MVYDPAFDMPKRNWLQQGSFENGTVPPVIDPDAGTQVCIGPFAREWLPFILGAMDQLRNPSSWIVADDAAMFATLARVTRLRQIFAQADTCVSAIPPQLRLTDGGELQLSVDGGTTWTTIDGWNDNLCPTIAGCHSFVQEVRLESCQLQTSSDGGTTWTTAAGWDPGFAECVQEQIPVIGLPPNPGDEPHDQFACSIAGYLADDVIRKALDKAISSITDDIALLGFGTIIVDLIPEFVLVTAAFNAFTIIYTAISEGTIADYEAARDDAGLWHDIRCAIYGCIRTIGYVTPANFACIVTAIGAVSYVHSDVIDTIVSFVESLGAIGLAQLSQRAGLVPGADCEGCGAEWCYEWSCASQGINIQPWSFPGPAEFGQDLGHIDGCFIVSDAVITQPDTNIIICDMSFAPTRVINIFVVHESTASAGGASRDVTGYLAGAVVGFGTLDSGSGLHMDNVTMAGATLDRFEIRCANLHGGVGAIEKISQVSMAGVGVNPFGEDNCVS